MRRFVLALIAFAAITTIVGVLTVVSAQTADPPQRFCNILPPDNPGWSVTGNASLPVGCSERAKWAVDIQGVVTRFKTWTEMQIFRDGRSATLYWEGPITQ